MIDMHIHVVPPGLPGVGSLNPLLRYAPELLSQTLREQMANAGITHAFAMGEWNTLATDPLGVHRTLQLAKHVPGLKAIGIMDPTKDAQDAAHFAAVERELSTRQVVALKGYLGYLHFDPSHATYRRYYELAEKYQLPVIFHTGDTYSPYAKLKYS
ncbi:MAG: amidohydrolase family protein, partial [Gemmataceae bacterium]